MNRKPAPTWNPEQSPLGEQRWVTEHAIRILRLPQVMDAVGQRRAAIYKLQAEGRFPRGSKLLEAELWAGSRQRFRSG